ncbi:MAG: hypothetical protein ISR48_05355 [Alphaproteobacteria bacterium]|nr:hypothetical protein [Alphaproteobacteria bacterium]
MSIFFAYDGSINNDWVARYAIRLASHDEDARLQLLHVNDGTSSPETIKDKIARIEMESSLMGVAFESEILSPGAGVAEALDERIPPGPESLLICGVRVGGRGGGLFSGTITERMMKLGLYSVLALRIVQPGLLGLPGNILVPVSGAVEGFHSGLSILNRLAPDIRELFLLRVMMLSRGHYRQLGDKEAEALRREGAEYLEKMEKELVTAVDLSPDRIEAIARISDDWVKEVLICASRCKSGLILMEVPRKSLKGKFLFGDKTEELLRGTPCDVALYRGIA